jgi:hypothetical protein
MSSPSPYARFFLQPELPRHRHYEVLRARFIEELTIKQIAHRFALSPLSVQSLIRDFKRDYDRTEPMAFFVELSPGPKRDRKKPQVREHVIRLRACGYADTDIHKALAAAGVKVSVSLIDQILREEGLPALGKRSREQRERIKAQIESGAIPGLSVAKPALPAIPAVADVRELDLRDGRTLYSRVAGVFLFVPFLIEVGLESVIRHAGIAGSKMIPALSSILSLLALKLLDKERKSHISDWNFDETLGWFAGLNVLPKTTATTDFSYRLVNGETNQLLGEWVRQAYPILCPESPGAFALDFHTIPHRGEPSTLENHYVPLRGKAVPSLQTCFARAIESPMLCYAQSDIVRKEQHEMPLRFVRFWHDMTGLKPDWLYFDSKMTNYAVLDQLRQQRINFVTIRRRGTRIIEKIRQRPPNDWKRAVIDTPQRRHQRIRYLDDPVKLRDYTEPCRQIAVDGLGRATPTLFLTNNEQASGREVVLRYTQRNSIENELGININFFHMDCLSSEVRLNVNLDVVMTVLANGCYRWLSNQLKGYQAMEPKQLYRKCVETAGHVAIEGQDLVVRFDRRSHNPLLAQAQLDKEAPPIPWLQQKRLRFQFR